MLIGNYSIANKHPGRTFTGITSNKTSRNIRFQFTDRASTPNGYVSPYSWNMAQKTGDLASYTMISGTGSASNLNLAGGLNIGAGITSSGYILTSNLSLVLSAACLIQSLGTFSSHISGQISASVTLSGNGDLIGSLVALGNAVSLINGTGSMVSSSFATANISAELTPFTDLSPESLSRAVWNALSSELNTSGTMGNKMNSAGSAGDPWSTILPSSYTGDQAGNIISRLEILISQVKALTAAQI